MEKITLLNLSGLSHEHTPTHTHTHPHPPPPQNVLLETIWVDTCFMKISPKTMLYVFILAISDYNFLLQLYIPNK